MYDFIARKEDENLALVSSGGYAVLIDTVEKDVLSVKSIFETEIDDSWEVDPQAPSYVTELASAALTDLSVKNRSTDLSRKLRVPKLEGKNPFADKVTIKEVQDFYLTGTYRELSDSDEIKPWVDKVLTKHPIADEDFSARGIERFYTDTDEEGNVKAVYAVSAGKLAKNVEGSWVPAKVSESDLTLTDAHTSLQALNTIIAAGSANIEDFSTDEWGLFHAAEAELDFEFLDRLSSVFSDDYPTYERSINAQKQVRGPGGKFVKTGAGSGSSAKSGPVARLPHSLPLVDDVNAMIDEYLTAVEQERAERPVQAAATAEQTGAEKSDVKPLYIAVVDNIDPDMVVDVVSLVPPKPGTQGDVSGWKRSAGQWVVYPEIVQQLRGSTPPPVVKLEDENVIKDVLAQVDKATASEAEQNTPEVDGTEADTPVTETGQPVPDSAPDATGPNGPTPRHRSMSISELSARGYAFSDGSLPILNVSDLREAVTQADSYEKQLHVIKRARALNRIDVLPKHWNINEYATSNNTVLWGPNGELLPVSAAGGIDRNRGGAEHLRRYWTRGPGGAKIAWGTPGDWRRCVSQLSKYLGVRSKGYCANRHKEMNGYWPGDKKNR